MLTLQTEQEVLLSGSLVNWLDLSVFSVAVVVSGMAELLSVGYVGHEGHVGHVGHVLVGSAELVDSGHSTVYVCSHHMRLSSSQKRSHSSWQSSVVHSQVSPPQSSISVHVSVNISLFSVGVPRTRYPRFPKSSASVRATKQANRRIFAESIMLSIHVDFT